MIKVKKAFNSSPGVDKFVLRLQMRSTAWTHRSPNTNMSTSEFRRFFCKKYFRAAEKDPTKKNDKKFFRLIMVF